MTRLALILALSLAVSALLCYGALRVASAIAKTSTTQIQQTERLIDQ